MFTITEMVYSEHFHVKIRKNSNEIEKLKFKPRIPYN